MTSTQPTLEVVIASCNRPKLLTEALLSAIIAVSQCKAAETRVVVSDNSTNSHSASLLSVLHGDIEVRSRIDHLRGVDHFNLILREASSDYIMIMHDDDRLMPQFLNRLVQTLEKNPSLSAAAANAHLIDSDSIPKGSTMIKESNDILLSSPQELLWQYFGDNAYNIAPFPAYIYRRKAIEDIHLNEEMGGKHSDVSYLCKVTERGPVQWFSEPLYVYRQHASNDTRAYSVGDRISLLNYLDKRYRPSPSNDFLSSLRLEVSALASHPKPCRRSKLKRLFAGFKRQLMRDG
jgi:glycosyltransferase involved in cell wall biosynthesis